MEAQRVCGAVADWPLCHLIWNCTSAKSCNQVVLLNNDHTGTVFPCGVIVHIARMHACTHTHSSYMTLIGVHEMHGRVHPN